MSSAPVQRQNPVISPQVNIGFLPHFELPADVVQMLLDNDNELVGALDL